MRFFKYEGLGNDFVIVEQPFGSLSTGAVKDICDRHRGVGADGVLFTGERDGRAFMKVLNADGSRPEMCGNGLRCVALYLVHAGIRAVGEAFEVDTDAGPHPCEVRDGQRRGAVTVQMRPASLDAREVFQGGAARRVEVPLQLDARQVVLSAVSMGNPHLVTFETLTPEAQEQIGPQLETDSRLRAGANVGFATMKAEGGLSLRVWERGVGWTQACGTGACAAAVAAVETGRAPRGQALSVELPGGALQILVRGVGERLAMTGPAARVFEGSWEP